MKSDIESTQSNNEGSFNVKIFFYCCDAQYQHLSVCLAEGFKELGIPFYSNVNHWQISPAREEYLFNHEPSVSPDDCTVVVVSHQWVRRNDLPEDLFQPERKYITVYLDDTDGPTNWDPKFNNFDLVLRTHYNNKGEYPSNYIPWFFGLSNRILQETNNIPNFQERKRRLLANFRVPQDGLMAGQGWLKVPLGLVRFSQALLIVDNPLRQIARDHFFPVIQEILPVDETVDNMEENPSDSYHYLQWTQTGRRHYPNYYQRLKESVACAGFGGWIAPNHTGENIVEWWDSWRFWESLAAGCVTFHVDFEKYGISLPVMPNNWQHYVGIDLDDIQSAIERIADEPEILERISREGRSWAIENYSPVPTALRFLKTIASYSSSVDNSPKLEGVSIERGSVESLPFKLRNINLIVFPDWLQPEESLYSILEEIVRFALSHPDKSLMTLLIDANNVSEEDANIFLSSVTMNLFLEEELDITAGAEILLFSKLNKMEWETLLPCLHSGIILDNQSEEIPSEVKAVDIPFSTLDDLYLKRAIQLETGIWKFE